MVSGDELIVIIKMSNGEQVMACLEGEDERYVELEYPILIRMMPSEFPNREQIAATPYCQFTDDIRFVVDKRNIMFIKKLHPQFIPHFQRFAAEYEQTEFTTNRAERQRQMADLEGTWGDEEPLTQEEVDKRLDMLESILGVEETEEEGIYVEGNDTIH
jgi:hypothetical protein